MRRKGDESWPTGQSVAVQYGACGRGSRIGPHRPGNRRSSPAAHETPANISQNRHDMTQPQPQFPAGWGAPQAPAQPGPQQFAPPVAPQQPPTPNPYVGQQPYNAYGNPQAYAPNPYAQAPAAPPVEQFTPAAGSLDAYVGQQKVGAKYWKFPQLGHVNVGMVARELRDTDVRQVSYMGQPVRRRDGSISTEQALYLPLVEQDGSESVWEVKGRNRDLLTAAVQAAGVASGLPEAGGVVRAQFVDQQQVQGTGAARKVLDVQYARPTSQGNPVAVPDASVSNVSIPASGAMVTPQPVQEAPAPAPAPVAPAPAPVPQAAPAVPQAAAAPNLSPDAAAQFQAMLGGAQQ